MLGEQMEGDVMVGHMSCWFDLEYKRVAVSLTSWFRNCPRVALKMDEMTVTESMCTSGNVHIC